MADVAVIMGSLSDWETMKQATHILEEFGIDFDKKVIRTPDTRNYDEFCEKCGATRL